MGFIDDSQRNARTAAAEAARAEMEEKNQAAIDAFCAAEHIDFLVNEVKVAIIAEYKRPDNLGISAIQLRYEVSPFVTRNPHCALVLFTALKKAEQKTSSVEFGLSAYYLDSTIEVSFNEPLK